MTHPTPAIKQARRAGVDGPPSSARVAQVVPSSTVLDSDDIQAEVERELAAARAKITARIVAEREAAAAARATIPAPAAPGEAAFTSAQLAQLAQLIESVAPAANAPARNGRKLKAWEGAEHRDLPQSNYAKTEELQVELLALLDLLGVVRVEDILEHIVRPNGHYLTPSSARNHMKKLVRQGECHHAEERYMCKAANTGVVLGWRTRDVWSKDPQKLLEVLERRKVVKS
jgi:hypothetical protein